VRQTAAAIAAGLRAFADQLETQPDALVSRAANASFTHFVCRRLPPHPSQLRDRGGVACTLVRWLCSV